MISLMRPQYESHHLGLFTKVLNYRLIKSRNIGAHIIDPAMAQITDISSHVGRYIGYFYLESDSRLALLLYARKNPASTSTHNYLFAVDWDNSQVPLAVLSGRIKKEVKRFTKSTIDVDMQTLLIRRNGPKYSHMESILQIAVMVISPTLYKFPLKTQCLDLKITIPYLLIDPIPPCNGPDGMQRVLQLIERRNVMKFAQFDDYNKLSDLKELVRFVVFHVDGHYSVLLLAEGRYSWMLYLPHRRQLSTKDASVLRKASQRLAVKLFGRTRAREYYGADLNIVITPSVYSAMGRSNCKNSEVASGFVVLLTLWPFHLLKIYPSDIICIDKLAEGPTVPITSFIESRDFYEATNEPMPLPSSDGCDALCPDYDKHSQETICLPDLELVRDELNALKREYSIHVWENIPPYAGQTMSDRRCRLLESDHIFNLALKQIVKQWELRATTICIESVKLDAIRGGHELVVNTGNQFFVCPILDLEVTALFIADNYTSRWYYLDVHRDLAKVQSNFGVFQQLLKDHLPDEELKPLSLVTATSYFHEKYPKVHLLMSAFTIAQQFRYATQMLSRVIYTERQFREYCWLISDETQRANHAYNDANGLLDQHGEMLPGARYSYSSPVQFQNAVVPTDICMFCRKRVKSNLGRHMSMAHGGQAKMANQARLSS